ncbi:MAG: hypothetical protein LC793_10945, partial [Thermomicrobia bacterium]|nr:hypothetical protein [Thermomicrobia bacterium]
PLTIADVEPFGVPTSLPLFAVARHDETTQIVTELLTEITRRPPCEQWSCMKYYRSQAALITRDRSQ